MVPGDMGAMFIIDVDNFKHINDSYGHMFGDAVLSKLAENISSIFPLPSDVVSRIGGDEFMVFMPHIPNAATAYSHAEQILNAFGGILHENMYSRNLSCSIGVAIATSEENDLTVLSSATPTRRSTRQNAEERIIMWHTAKGRKQCPEWRTPAPPLVHQAAA